MLSSDKRWVARYQEGTGSEQHKHWDVLGYTDFTGFMWVLSDRGTLFVYGGLPFFRFKAMQLPGRLPQNRNAGVEPWPTQRTFKRSTLETRRDMENTNHRMCDVAILSILWLQKLHHLTATPNPCADLPKLLDPSIVLNLVTVIPRQSMPENKKTNNDPSPFGLLQGKKTHS